MEPSLYITEGNFIAKRYLMQPEEARKRIQSGLYPRQRRYRPYHGEFLRGLVARQRFRPGSPIDVACLEGPGGFIELVVNGQHTLHAIDLANVPVWVTLIAHKITSTAELDWLYTTFDRQLPRTPKDMLQAYGWPEGSGLLDRECGVLMGAMPMVLSGFQYVEKSSKEPFLMDLECHYTAALRWAKEAEMYCSDIKGQPRRWHGFLLRKSLMALACVMYRHQAGRAETFWTHVAKEDHPDPQHPTRRLARWFQGDAMHEQIGAKALTWKVADAWNAFCRKRSFVVNRPSETAKPLSLDGTPHDSTRWLLYITRDYDLLDAPRPWPPAPAAPASPGTTEAPNGDNAAAD